MLVEGRAIQKNKIYYFLPMRPGPSQIELTLDLSLTRGDLMPLYSQVGFKADIYGNMT